MEPDTGLTTGISYTIVAGMTGRFSIDSSGIITASAVLDWEELQCTTLCAYCGGKGQTPWWDLSRLLCPGEGSGVSC